MGILCTLGVVRAQVRRQKCAIWNRTDMDKSVRPNFSGVYLAYIANGTFLDQIVEFIVSLHSNRLLALFFSIGILFWFCKGYQSLAFVLGMPPLWCFYCIYSLYKTMSKYEWAVDSYLLENWRDWLVCKFMVWMLFSLRLALSGVVTWILNLSLFLSFLLTSLAPVYFCQKKSVWSGWRRWGTRRLSL